MTCVVGVIDAGRVYMGADSAGVAGDTMTIRADKKVFVNGPFIMGFTSSFRMGQLLRYAFTPPPHDPPDMDPYRYMVTTFVDAVRACFKAGGYVRRDHEQESGGNFLVGYRNRLFEINSDFQVGEAVDGYNAVGSGERAALGALFATQGQDPVRRVAIALRAAEHVSASVRGPFTIVSLETRILPVSAASLPPAATPEDPSASAA